MSSEDMNEILKRNIEEFEKAIRMLQEQKPEPVPEVVTRLIYDPETLFVVSTTTEETDLPHIVVTQEQLDSGILYKPMKVINGQLVEDVPTDKPTLPLTEGDKWKTSESNMLVMGNEKGWNERKHN